MQPWGSFLGSRDVTEVFLVAWARTALLSSGDYQSCLLSFELELALGRDQFITRGNSIVLSGSRESSMLGAGLEPRGSRLSRMASCHLELVLSTWERQTQKVWYEAASIRLQSIAGYQRVGFWVPRETPSCLCLPLCLSGSGDGCKGPGVSWLRGPWETSHPHLSCPILRCLSALTRRPVVAPHPAAPQYRAGEPFKLSACRGKHGTVPTHTVVCCYPAALLPCRPAALPPGPGLGTWCMYSYEVQFQPWEVEDTCKTVPLGEWREAKGVFMHRRPLQYVRPQTSPFANPQTTDCSIEGAIICFFVPIHFC